jgi:hypothetical protein
MIAEPLFYKLLLVSLVWLCLVLHLVWSDDRARAGHSTPLPAKTPRKRSQEPKPFAGLTQQPLCTLCEQEIAHPTAPPPLRPDPMPPTHRRPREVDTSMHFCPSVGCAYQRRFPRSEILQQSGMRLRSFCPENRMTCDGKVDRFILPSG